MFLWTFIEVNASVLNVSVSLNHQRQPKSATRLISNNSSSSGLPKLKLSEMNRRGDCTRRSSKHCSSHEQSNTVLQVVLEPLSARFWSVFCHLWNDFFFFFFLPNSVLCRILMFELCWSRADIAMCDFPAQGSSGFCWALFFKTSPKQVAMQSCLHNAPRSTKSVYGKLYGEASRGICELSHLETN